MKRIILAIFLCLVGVAAYAATITLLPNPNHLSITVNGRTYTGVAGTPQAVPDFDANMLMANGWTSALDVVVENVTASSAITGGSLGVSSAVLGVGHAACWTSTSLLGSCTDIPTSGVCTCVTNASVR